MQNMCKLTDFYEGDKVEVKMKDGKVISGTIILLTWADDTETGREDISIENDSGVYVAFIDEIDSYKKIA